MYLKVFIAVILSSLLTGLNAKPFQLDSGAVCETDTIRSLGSIGENNEVTVESVACSVPNLDFARRDELTRRQTNVCGAACTTHCFTPSGGGPDPNQCNVIADALRFASENTGPIFQIPFGTNGTNTITMKYQSCRTFFVNQQPSTVLEYCRTDWAALVDFIAPNCQSTQNAHGGLCVPSNQAWFVQVDHSV